MANPGLSSATTLDTEFTRGLGLYDSTMRLTNEAATRYFGRPLHSAGDDRPSDVIPFSTLCL